MDSTREKITFSTTPELLQVIHKCERVTAPEKAQGLGFIKTAAHQVLDEIPFMKAEDKDNYDKKVAFDILKWIFSPSDPARELAMRGKR
ncbi:hypothetical protein BDBG_02547 [Blastomyces gilchristii SLH14081]|uniref:Uncharacterized protein n=1 Tax=Blastomyces gilchristii (strain SLH14081) TaxID=559298 RepID=A0A179UGF4_BLAGS|nr:uncharacterized protein BDBG_02547 [Blastomyces gilchristii SLH14081]OAT06309.1 hypothetical protein BDBG_02547 [Blastomyces gilchristii SLH14081]